MRFLIVPSPTGNPNAHAEAAMDEGYFNATMKFNEDMHKAGVLVASEGLQPSTCGAHVLVPDLPYLTTATGASIGLGLAIAGLSSSRQARRTSHAHA